MQHLQPNTTLQGGKYRIERVLGQGGFGITYLAMQTSLQRKVAIKEFFMKDFCSRDEATTTMLGNSTGSNKLVEQYKRKFIQEARNLAKLNHPHIVSVIDVFEENDTVYYAMPYLSGGSLQDYVNSRGTLSETEAMRYVKQIASALRYMHEERHMCHFDVKPANIMLDDKGDALLIDFGISKNYDRSGQETSTTPIGLSEGYAPIEQYDGKSLGDFSPACDVYALGATLYCLLHGKRPVSAIERISGTPLRMKSYLSENIKRIIDASMKVSKTERANSVDVFLRTVSTPAKSDSDRHEKSYGWLLYLVLGLIGVGIVLYITNYHNSDYSDSVELTEKESVEYRTTDAETFENVRENISENTINYIYHYNERFKFKLLYPDFMRVQPTSTNGDGICLMRDKDTYIIASGSYNVLDLSIEELFNNEHKKTDIYSRLKDDWFVRSGYNDDGTIFYAKSVLKNDTIFNITFNFREEDRELFDEIISKVLNSWSY